MHKAFVLLAKCIEFNVGCRDTRELLMYWQCRAANNTQEVRRWTEVYRRSRLTLTSKTLVAQWMSNEWYEWNATVLIIECCWTVLVWCWCQWLWAVRAVNRSAPTVHTSVWLSAASRSRVLVRRLVLLCSLMTTEPASVSFISPFLLASWLVDCYIKLNYWYNLRRM